MSASKIECAWCGAGEPEDGRWFTNRRGESFCRLHHRSASAAALRRLEGRKPTPRGTMIRLGLSPAQQSAFECRDWLSHDADPETAPFLSGLLDGTPTAALCFQRAHAETVAWELTALSNAEDEGAREAGCKEAAKLGRRAARSFTALSSRVLKALARTTPCHFSEES